MKRFHNLQEVFGNSHKCIPVPVPHPGILPSGTYIQGNGLVYIPVFFPMFRVFYPFCPGMLPCFVVPYPRYCSTGYAELTEVPKRVLKVSQNSRSVRCGCAPRKYPHASVRTRQNMYLLFSTSRDSHTLLPRPRRRSSMPGLCRATLDTKSTPQILSYETWRAQ